MRRVVAVTLVALILALPVRGEVSAGSGAELFEGWNTVDTWPSAQINGASNIASALDASVSPNAWEAIARFEGGAWLLTYADPPLPSFNTLAVAQPGLSYWIYVRENAVLAEPLGTRENPIPINTPVQLVDGWQVRVLSVTPDATQAVLDENQFNDPPADGHQFFIATIEMTYQGPGSSHPDATFRFRAVGEEAVTYSTFGNSCGVYPDRIMDTEVFTSGTVTGNLCWEIRSADSDSLVMFDDEASQQERVYMALHD